jgi:uncharacterized protein
MILPHPGDQRFQELNDQAFTFSCHSGLACFNQCCRRLELWLTPYDCLRLNKRLGISGEEFIERYTEVEPGQNGWPMPKLKMNEEDPERTCPFLTSQGCGVYEDRPGACRTYPLGRATKLGKDDGPLEEGFFLVREEHCLGFDQGRQWTPQDWTRDQGLETYNQVNDLFLPLITRQAADPDPQIIAKKMRMFFMACYNLEQFKSLVTGSRFRQLFLVDDLRWDLVAVNDLELLRLAFDWLRFSIFADPTLSLRPGVADPNAAARSER